MTAELLLLRLVHILGGIFWVGSGLFTTFFLIPALGRTGPAAAGPVMGALQQRRLFTVLPTVAVLTILSGIRLLQITSAGFSGAYLATLTGRTFLWSGLAAIAAFSRDSAEFRRSRGHTLDTPPRVRGAGRDHATARWSARAHSSGRPGRWP